MICVPVEEVKQLGVAQKELFALILALHDNTVMYGTVIDSKYHIQIHFCN